MKENKNFPADERNGHKTYLSRISFKFLTLLFLSCFLVTSVVEARPHTSSGRHVSKAQKRVLKSAPRKKREKAVRHRSHRVKATRVRRGHGRVRTQRHRPQAHARGARRAQHLHRQPVQQIVHSLAVTQTPMAPSPLSYVAQQNTLTQKNIRRGELDKLYLKNLNGQGQTIAVIEESGTYKKLRDAIHYNTLGILSSEKREKYRTNFLTAIGDPRPLALHPEEQNDITRIIDKSKYHGAAVSSIALDLASQAKILPVSTYSPSGSPEFYDVADALMVLSQREDVKIINISAGHIDATATSRSEQDANGVYTFLYKSVYTPKLVEAFKAVVQAGKVIVLAAGNNEHNIAPPQFKPFTAHDREPASQIMGHLIENLDVETRQSVILAGAMDVDTNAICGYSNKPGEWAEAQERFLFAPGRHALSYDDLIVGGTSYASPYICAAIADLCSKPGVTPKLAVKALLESAEERPEKAIYGRGIIRAHRALELLEDPNWVH